MNTLHGQVYAKVCCPPPPRALLTAQSPLFPIYPAALKPDNYTAPRKFPHGPRAMLTVQLSQLRPSSRPSPSCRTLRNNGLSLSMVKTRQKQQRLFSLVMLAVDLALDRVGWLWTLDAHVMQCLLRRIMSLCC